MTITAQNALRFVPASSGFTKVLCNQFKIQLTEISDTVRCLLHQAEEQGSKDLCNNLQAGTFRLLNLVALMESEPDHESNDCSVEAIIYHYLNVAVKVDERFLSRLVSSIEANISNEKYDPESLAENMHVSRSQLYQKIRVATGLSAGALVRKVRLRRATQLLKTTSLSISEVAYKVGFSDQAYFTKCFRREHALSPKQYRKLHQRLITF